MKGKAIFRKMNLLYIVVIALLLGALFAVYADYSSKRATLESEIDGTYLAVRYDKEQKEIKGTTEMTRIKSSNFIIKVDSSLTGSQCKTNDTKRFAYNPKELELVNYADGIVKCTVTEKVDASEIYPYDVLVSQETYDSIKDNMYTYLVKVDSYKTFKKLLMRGDSIIPSGISSEFKNTFSMYYATVYTLNSLVVITALLIVIIYINMLSFIKANTKKTKKKKDDPAKRAIDAAVSTIVSVVLGTVLIYLIFVIQGLFNIL